MFPDQAVQPTPHPTRHAVFVATKIAVSVVLLTWLFSKIPPDQRIELWRTARSASLAWLAAAMVLYSISVLASIWRWRLLLGAQDVVVPGRSLLGSFLVALFFNNFLPSNIGGDVIRIRDTARPAQSTTVATIVVLADRVMGLMGLVLVAAVGATAIVRNVGSGRAPILPIWLWAGFALGAIAFAQALLAPAGVGRLLQPLIVLHPEWVGGRIERLTAVLEKFRGRPAVLANCFGGAIFVQATNVLFYVAVTYALRVNIAATALFVIVPISFIAQMLPVSVNGFGVREGIFTFYFGRLGLPIESALLVSLVATALVMLFSLSGAAVYVARGRH